MLRKKLEIPEEVGEPEIIIPEMPMGITRAAVDMSSGQAVRFTEKEFLKRFQLMEASTNFLSSMDARLPSEGSFGQKRNITKT